MLPEFKQEKASLLTTLGTTLHHGEFAPSFSVLSSPDLIGYRRIFSHLSLVCFPASSGFPGSGGFYNCFLLTVNLSTYCPESLTDVPCINRAAAAAQ